jgi:hypothetical protein
VPKVLFIYLVATPTEGSLYAKMVSLASSNPRFRDMYPLKDVDSYLGSLQSNWLAGGYRIKSCCGYEVLSYGDIKIVDKGSAINTCTERLAPIAANHVDIGKPMNDRHVAYQALSVAMAETFPRIPQTPTGPPETHFSNTDKEACMNGDIQVAIKACAKYAGDMSNGCTNFNPDCRRRVNCWADKQRSLIFVRDACQAVAGDLSKVSGTICADGKRDYASILQADCDQ